MGLGTACQKCAVRQRALCGALSDQTLQRFVHRRRAPTGNVILEGDEQPNWIGIILTGVVKLMKTSEDGRRQIVALQFPGQFVGRPQGRPSPFLAEAATDIELCCFAMSAFDALLRENRALEQVVMNQALEELDLAREWMFVLGRKTAKEKVASLLLLIAHHLAPDGEHAYGACAEDDQAADLGPVEFALPLSRTEMADYLGLTIETVSRQMSNMKENGIICVKGARMVTVPDVGALQRWGERDQG
ncbi:MAG: Crp/Fnr family transcriptional regulator [Hyphomicrobium sp.]|jgi:CRP/FNR family transcriptional regulator